MLVALMASLRALEGQSDFDGEFVQVCRDTETRLLGFPAGTQDYEVALRGGLQILSYGPGAGTFERAAVDLDQLSRHLVLFDSGSSHASGLNNWEVYRSCIEGDTAVREALGGVRDAALTMTEAARRGDVEAMGKALGDEWRWRRRLSARVSTPILDEAAEKGLAAGAWGAKVCGAGGGGVMVFLGPAELRQEISRRLSKISGQAILDARPESRGLLREV